MAKCIDLVGQYFTNWFVESRAPNGKYGTVMYNCLCKCGNKGVVSSQALRLGKSKSCGCLQGELISKSRKTHGMTDSRLYDIWCSMKSRCNTPSVSNYKNYGARGIHVCEKWLHNFEAFRDWAIAAGYSDDLSLDRIDVNGNYEPDNCQFIPIKDQARNKRNTHYVEYNGEQLSLPEACEKAGLDYDVVKQRINRLKWDDQRALTTPTVKYDEITFNGITMPLKAWARKLNINPDTLRWRIKRVHWPIERALTEPVRTV